MTPEEIAKIIEEIFNRATLPPEKEFTNGLLRAQGNFKIGVVLI